MSSQRFGDNHAEATQGAPAATPTTPPSDGARLTEQEAQGVIALWNTEAAQQEAARAQPTLAAVADTLGIPKADVHRLLTAVHDKQQAALAVQRKHRQAVVAIAVGIVGAWGITFNTMLTQTNQEQGMFIVQSIGVRPAVPADNVLATYPLSRDVTRMDVRLRYNPPSLWHFLVGPRWQPVPVAPYLTTQAGPRIETFLLPGGSRAGITEGWLRRTGAHEYTEGFAFPADALPKGSVTLWFSCAADNNRQQTLAAAVQAAE